MQPSTWRCIHVGTWRYAGERWVYSHPEVQPCSSIGGTRVNKADPDFGPRLVKEPRPANVKFTNLKLHHYRTSFARLSGRLFEWRYLYRKEPPHIWS